jgi:hypothetical protein
VIQAFISTYSRRYEVVEFELTRVGDQGVSGPLAPDTGMRQPAT